MALPKKSSYLMGGTFNSAPFTLTDGDLSPLQVDANGNLLVNLAAGSISINGNAAAGPTGAAVPADADYLGVNIGGLLTGVTGLALGATTKAPTVAIVDGNGNQITSFGGGTQFADNAASGATPTGTLAMGWDSNAATIRALTVDLNRHLEVSSPSIVDTNNSTTTLLGSGATFTGTATELLPYKGITVNTFADQSGSLSVEWSSDGTNWDFIQTFSVSAGVAVSNILTIRSRFFRVVYINGANAQTNFRQEVLLHPSAVNLRTTSASSNILSSDEAVIVSAILSASNLSGTANGKLKQVNGGLLISGEDGTGNGNIISVAMDGSLSLGTVLVTGGIDTSGNAAAFHVNGGALAITVQTVGADSQSNNALGVLEAAGGQIVNLSVWPSIFNGTTWDRLRSGGATGMVGVAGAAASGVAKAGNPVQVGAVFNTTQPTVTNGQAVENQATARGALIVATGVDTFNVAFSAAQHVIVDSGSIGITGAVDVSDRAARLVGHVTVDNVTLAVTQSTNPWVISGSISFTTPQHVIVDSGAITVSGTVTGNQGTPNTLANAWPHEITDGVNGPVAVKAASTAPLATDPSLVISVSPNSTIGKVQVDPYNNLLVGVNNFTEVTETLAQLLLLAECSRRALVALACEGNRNKPVDFDPSVIAQEEGADDYAD